MNIAGIEAFVNIEKINTEHAFNEYARHIVAVSSSPRRPEERASRVIHLPICASSAFRNFPRLFSCRRHAILFWFSASAGRASLSSVMIDSAKRYARQIDMPVRVTRH